MRLHPEPPRNFTWNFALPKTSLFPQNIQNFSKPFEFSQLLNFSQNLLWHISRTSLEPAGTSRTNFTKFPKTSARNSCRRPRSTPPIASAIREYTVHRKARLCFLLTFGFLKGHSKSHKKLRLRRPETASAPAHSIALSI